MNATYFIGSLFCYLLLQIKKGKDETGLHNRFNSAFWKTLTSVPRSTRNSKKPWKIQRSTQQLYRIIIWPNSSSFKILVYLLQATIHYHLIFNKKSGMFQMSFNGIRIMCALKYLCLPWDGRIIPVFNPPAQIADLIMPDSPAPLYLQQVETKFWSGIHIFS